MRRLLLLGITSLTVAFGVMQIGGSKAIWAEAETNTATVNEADCIDFGGGGLFSGTYCFRIISVQHSTVQPDGDPINQNHGLFCESLVFNPPFEQFSSSFCNKSHTPFVFRGGETQVVHNLNKREVTSDGETCTFTTHFVLANGEVRVDHIEVECEPAG